MMKKAILWGIIFMMVVAVVAAQQATMLSLHGEATDSVGDPVNGGNLRVTVSTSDSCTEDLQYDYTYNGLIQGGVFSTLLGNDTNLNLTYNQDYFLCTFINGQVQEHADGSNTTKFRGGQGEIPTSSIDDNATFSDGNYTFTNNFTFGAGWFVKNDEEYIYRVVRDAIKFKDLVDRSANENITGNWTFSGSINIAGGSINKTNRIFENSFAVAVASVLNETDYQDSVIDDFSTDSLSESNVVYDGTSRGYWLAPDPDGTATETANLTDSIMDVDWGITAGGNGVCTFDASGDEVDMSASATSGDCYVTFLGDEPLHGTAMVAFRNIVGFGGETGTGTYLSLTWGNTYIRYAHNGLVLDSVGGSDDIGSESTLYLRIRRVGYWIQTEYSTDGSSWTTLSTSTTAGDPSSGVKPQGNALSLASGSQSASQFVAKIYDGVFESSGTVTSATFNAPATAELALAKWFSDTDSLGGNITAEVSLDGGSNYVTVQNGIISTITNTGTQPKIRFTLTNSSESPMLKGYGLTWS